MLEKQSSSADIETLEAQVHEKNNSQASLQSFSEEGEEKEIL